MHTRIRHYFLLVFLLALGYWMLFVYTLPNDLLDCWLPWRHFVSKGFHNGIVPLWNPYHQLGYPVYADLQGPLFSLENFITGSWFRTDLTTLQSILFAYICVAAIGMYELGVYLFKNRQAAFVIALGYALGGFFNHHLQHFFTIVSVSLVPFTLLLVLKFLEEPKWKYLLGLVLVLHLTFTTGNQAFTIIQLHFIIVLFLRKIFILFRQGSQTQAWKLIRQSCFLFVFTFLAILPVLVAFWQSKAYVDRYSGLEYAHSLVNSMTPVAFQSFINPFISAQPPAYLGTDPSMAGYFFGFILFSLSVSWFVFTREKSKWWLLALVVLFALLSLGKTTPLHYWIYQLDPLFRLFRFPAYYMFYVYFILLITAGYMLTHLFENKIALRKPLLVFAGITGTVLVIALMKGLDKGALFYHLRTGRFDQAMQGLSLSSTYTFALGLVVLTGIVTAVLYYWRRKKTVLMAGIALEMVLTCNLAMAWSLMPVPAAQTDGFIASLPKGYALPPQTLGDNEKLLPHLPAGTWRNYHAYFNVVYPDFFNSFYLHSILEWEKDPHIKKTDLWKNRREHSVQLKRFEPGLMVFETPLGKAETLVINQLYFPGWKLYLNRKETKLQEGTIMTIRAPEGTTEIKLVFENPVMVFCFWFALGFTALVAIVLLGLYCSRIIFAISSVGLLVLLLGALYPFMFKPSTASNKTLSKKADTGTMVVNKAKPVMETVPGVYDARLELNGLLFQLLSSESDHLTYIDSGNFNPPAIEKALQTRFGKVVKTREGEILRYDARSKKPLPEALYFHIDSVVTNQGWMIPEHQLGYDSVAREKYCLLNGQQTYGPGVELKNMPAGHECFFVLNTHQEIRVSDGGELLVVLDILRENQSQIYLGRLLTAEQEQVVFFPRYTFKGDETVKIYYWLNGKGEGEVRVKSQWLRWMPVE